MKKLGKLTLNELQEFAPLSPQEQMSMKGGNSKIWWYIAYEVAKGIYEYYTSSESSSSITASVCPTGNAAIYEADSASFDNGVTVYSPSIICIPLK